MTGSGCGEKTVIRMVKDVQGMNNRRQLDQDMQLIRDDLLRLSSLVDRAIKNTFKAFVNHDEVAATDVINGDAALDEMHQKIEYQVEKTVALQQPTARDLRTIIASLLIASELERMGDHAEGMSRIVVRDSGSHAGDVPINLHRMREFANLMLRDAMDAFVGHDVEKAKQTAAMDAQVDELYKELFDTIIPEMGSGATTIERGTYLLWAGHNLERICDRATNICERVLYMRTGDVDNLNLKPEEEAASSD